MMGLFLEAILPGDADLGLPSGAHINMARYAAEQGIEVQLLDFFMLLDIAAREMSTADFAGLDPAQRMACLERVKRKNRRLADTVIVHCLKAYYTDAGVLRSLSAGAVPPFPEGNVLDEDDWTMLGPVCERGPLFRPAPR